MGLQPKIKRKVLFRDCPICGNTLSLSEFAPTTSIFYPDGVIPICGHCIDNWLKEQDWNWDAIDKLCQMADIPFIPKEWENLKEMSEDNLFARYAMICQKSEYYGVGWKKYYDEYQELKKNGDLGSVLPLIGDAERQELQLKWGSNYDDEQLTYLENLYKGILTSQSVNGALQDDRALKICKISLEIDERIRAGEDFDKLLASHDKLVKQADFTPTNIKNLNDFDSIGELVKWMEKKGWQARYHDGVTRDIVDETVQNIQSFNQRLYTNESGISEQIEARIASLKNVKDLEDNFGSENEFKLEDYDNEGYKKLMEEEFEEDVDE